MKYQWINEFEINSSCFSCAFENLNSDISCNSERIFCHLLQVSVETLRAGLKVQSKVQWNMERLQVMFQCTISIDRICMHIIHFVWNQNYTFLTFSLHLNNEFYWYTMRNYSPRVRVDSWNHQRAGRLHSVNVYKLIEHPKDK